VHDLRLSGGYSQQGAKIDEILLRGLRSASLISSPSWSISASVE
jgi:hypothetical protein